MSFDIIWLGSMPLRLNYVSKLLSQIAPCMTPFNNLNLVQFLKLYKIVTNFISVKLLVTECKVFT